MLEYACTSTSLGTLHVLPRNLNIILVAFIVSMLSYLSVASTKNAILVGEAMYLIDELYVDPVDHDALVEGAMTGMTSKLDEHSEYNSAPDVWCLQRCDRTRIRGRWDLG